MTLILEGIWFIICGTPSGVRVQMMLQGTQINNMPDKSHVIISLLSMQKAKSYKSIS